MDSEQMSAKEREDRALRKLRFMVELTQRVLRQEDMTLVEAIRYVKGARNYALTLFPGKESAWELLYRPQLERILRQRWNYVSNDTYERVS